MKVQLLIDNVEIDLPENAEDIPFALSYSISDLKHPEKRKQSSSKKITLPGTRNNNNFFASTYDYHLKDTDGSGFGFDFDPTLRHDCIVKRNGAIIFNGGMVLDSVDIQNGVKSYNITLHAKTTNIFQALGDTLVSELGWDAYDHTLSVANIQASWTTPAGSGYLYPYIHFGLAENPTYIKTNELKPYVYCKEIVEKCFEKTGFTLVSSFMETSFFKKFVWGHGGGEQVRISSAEQTLRRAHYSGDGSNTNVYSPSSSTVGLYALNSYNYQDVGLFGDTAYFSSTLITDSYTQFDESAGELNIANTGRYKLAFSGTLDVTYTLPGTGWSMELRPVIVVYKNFAVLTSQEITILDSATGSDSVVFSLSQEFDCDAGDVITVKFAMRTAGTVKLGSVETLTLNWDFNNTIDYDLTATDNAVVDGDTVILASTLPKMKASDFLRDMLTIFNLYMDDPNNDKEVRLEPFTTFYYDTNDVDDWTKKIDLDSDISIEPASTIEGKSYVFNWAQDRDQYKLEYFNRYGVDYGDYIYDVPSTYKVGEKVYKVKIAQSVPVQVEGTDLIIPWIVQQDTTTDTTRPHKGKPRMFIYQGSIATSSGWTLVNSDTGAETALSTYPRVHHLDSLTTATFDLNFGTPIIIFYAGTTYTTDNLFNRYHYPTVRELTSRDSKIVNVMANLLETDLYTGFMRRLCMINGAVFRKNIIKDFRVNKNQLTKVELIRVTEPRSKGATTGDIPDLTGNPFGLSEGGGGGQGDPIVTDTSINSWQRDYAVDSSGGTVTLTADVASLRQGTTFTVTKIDSGANPVTIAVTDSNGILTPLIAGAQSFDLLLQWEALTFYYDGLNFTIR